jgi:hypothetical protein
MAGKPFEVYADCGSATPVRFTLSEDAIRNHPGYAVKVALADKGGDPDDRTRLWRASLTIARNLIKHSDEGPIEIYDGRDVWVIPEHSVRWVRLHDPESPDKRGSGIGFRIEAGRPARD